MQVEYNKDAGTVTVTAKVNFTDPPESSTKKSRLALMIPYTPLTQPGLPAGAKLTMTITIPPIKVG